MTSFSVLIPWRSDNGSRQEVFDWIISRYEAFFGDQAQLCIADSGHEPFNRAASRNMAFEEAEHRLVLIADADTTPQRYFTYVFEDITPESLSYVYPYRTYYAIKSTPTNELLQHPPDVHIPPPDVTEIEFRMESWAGSICMPSKAFEYINGYDEGFTGWGYEDTAFRESCKRLLTGLQRPSGHVVHLWHPNGKEQTWDQPEIKKNERRFMDYQKAGSSELMKDLVESRRGLRG